MMPLLFVFCFYDVFVFWRCFSPVLSLVSRCTIVDGKGVVRAARVSFTEPIGSRSGALHMIVFQGFDALPTFSF